MTGWKGSAEQRESAHLKARRTAGSADPSDQALERYLRLQAGQGVELPEQGAHDLAADGLASRPTGTRAGGRLHHEHRVINGRGVEVTEDAIGVVELHLD